MSDTQSTTTTMTTLSIESHKIEDGDSNQTAPKPIETETGQLITQNTTTTADVNSGSCCTDNEIKPSVEKDSGETPAQDQDQQQSKSLEQEDHEGDKQVGGSCAGNGSALQGEVNATGAAVKDTAVTGESNPKLDINTGDIRRMSSKGAIDVDEYLIAADLTLYSNPLNSALRVGPREKTASKAEKTEVKDDDDEHDTIAADMTKYDSPMADLDKRYNDKKDKEQAISQTNKAGQKNGAEKSTDKDI